MNIHQNIVITAEDYGRIDGRNAYRTGSKRLTLGAPVLDSNRNMPIAAQVWSEDADGNPELNAELPIHQVFDLMIVLSRALLYFRDAYRLPLLYDPEKPMIDRIGLQGDAMSVSVCTENPNIDTDIQAFSQSLSDLGELTGERLRVLCRLVAELECY